MPAEGQVSDCLLAVRHTSGAIAEVIYHAFIYPTDSGEPLGVFAAARDIGDLTRPDPG